METENNNPITTYNFQLSDVLIIFTILGPYFYFFLNTFELGYASYFNIPSDLVSINLINFYYESPSIILIILCVVIFIPCFFMAYYFLTHDWKKKIPFYKRILLSAILRLIIFGLFLNHHYDILGLKFITLKNFIIFFSIVIIITVLDILVFKEQKNVSSLLHPLTIKRLRVTYIVISIIINSTLIGYLFTFSLGYSNAKANSTYYKLNQDKIIIIRMYDEHWIGKSKEDFFEKKENGFLLIDKSSAMGQKVSIIDLPLK